MDSNRIHLLNFSVVSVYSREAKLKYMLSKETQNRSFDSQQCNLSIIKEENVSM